MQLEGALPPTRSPAHTISLAVRTARACWPPITVTPALELHSARTIVATVTDEGLVTAVALATRTDMAGAAVGASALAGDLDLGSDGDGAGAVLVTRARTGGLDTTAAIRSGDGDARAPTMGLRTTQLDTALLRVRIKLMGTRVTTAMAGVTRRPTQTPSPNRLRPRRRTPRLTSPGRKSHAILARARLCISTARTA